MLKEKDSQMTRESNASIKYCPQCGSKALTWPSPKHFTCADCGFVLYLNIAAAVAVIIECQGKILLGVRRYEPKKGMLDLPGGFVDPAETAEQAVCRELKEELAIELCDELRYLFSFPNKYLYRGIEYDTLDLIYLVRLHEFPQFTAGDDLAEALWVDRNALDYQKIGFDSLRQALQRYLEASAVPEK